MTLPLFQDSNLDEALASAYEDLKNFKANEDDYQKTLNQIEKLHKLKSDLAQKSIDAKQFDDKHQLDREQFARETFRDALPFYKRVDPNVYLTVAGNVFIGLAVIKYEQTGVISSKVMSFMRKI